MTYQEVLWQDEIVIVVGAMSKSKKIHYDVLPFVGKCGKVLREAKNGMLLVDFKDHVRSIPAGCVVNMVEAKFA